ncbi:MAG: hypothetical protein WA908_12435, partial [Pontixanthobacter sp.]
MKPAANDTETTEISQDSYASVRGDESIQFAPVAIEEPEEPEPSWFADMLDDLFAFLGDLFDPVGGALGSSWPIL